MTFDFVVETPQNRKINRNSNKIIQKRATQAAARTRLERKHDKSTYPIIKTNSTGQPIRSASQGSTPGNVLLSNAKLANLHNSPFLAHFGRHDQILYLQDPGAFSPTGCFSLPEPTLSILQRQLLASLSPQPVGRDVRRLFKIMNYTHGQFLGHLPSHYGHLPFLDEAMACLIARLHDVVPLLKPDATPMNQLSPTALYGKALTSLRSTINNNLAQDLTYVCFAIMLLTFEVRDPFPIGMLVR